MKDKNELEKCANSIIYFMKNYCNITDKDGPRPFNEKLIKELEYHNEMLEKGYVLRLIKGRKSDGLCWLKK